MMLYDLHAIDGDELERLDAIEANDVGEAISLSVIRLEHRDMVLRNAGKTVAHIAKDGRIIRMDDPPVRPRAS